VHLIITSQLEKAIVYAKKANLNYKYNLHEFSFEVDEADIGSTLISLANAGVVYTNVSIDKPSLQDYFFKYIKKGIN